MKKTFEYVEGIIMLVVLMFVCILLKDVVVNEQVDTMEYGIVYEND